MLSLQRNPQKVRSFFQSTFYAPLLPRHASMAMIAALQKGGPAARPPYPDECRSHGCRAKTVGTEVSGVASAGEHHAVAVGLRP
jgi:hypothetical protein